MYIKGYSAQDIANMIGLKYERLVTQILKRKSNYGVIEYNDVIYQGKHEPIISKEIYDIAMQEMVRRSVTNVTTSRNLLTGLVYCGKCGAKMRYQKWGKNGYKFVCYSQQKSKPHLIKDPNCNQEKCWVDEVENEVIKVLFCLKEKHKDSSEESISNSVLDVMNDQRENLERKIKRLYNLYAESEDDILIESINENKKSLEKIKKKINIEIKQQNINVSRNKVKDTLISLEDKWEYMTPHEKQNIVRILINKVIIEDDKLDIKLNI